MNATQLLTHFDRLAEAPDAVPRLRRFILDLAVRGKLVEQDTKDEPAITLLKLITSSPQGKAKVTTAASLIEPWPLPSGWQFARFAEILTLEYGDNLPAEKRSNSGEFPVYGSNGIVGSHHEAFVQSPCIVVGRKGSAGALNLCLASGCCVTDVAYYCIPPQGVDLHFAFKMFHTIGLDTLGKGIKPGLSRAEAYELVVPLPPLAEQHRIVAKVDELMALCDQLEAAQQERERRRDRLAAASLQRLNQPADADPATDQTEPAEARQQAQREQQKDHARFHLQNLNRLTTRPEHIKAMRQTFLNLAVRGKLLRQDANDESAHVLLTQIELEKSRASRKKLATKQAPGESIEIPPFFGESLPDGWAISKLGDLCTKTGSGSTPAGGKDAYVSSGTPFLRSQNIYDDGLRMDSVAYISEATQTRMSATTVMPKDVLLNITGGSIGRCAIVPDNFDAANINQHVAIIRLAVPDCGRFVHCVIRSDYFQAQIFGNQTGAGREGLPKNRMDEIPIPVPPLDEQRRIVAKADELMALCDQLEVQLIQSQTDSRKLLEVIFDGMLGMERNAVDKTPNNMTAPNVEIEHQQVNPSRFMTTNPVTNVEQLLQCIDDLGGDPSPDRLLTHTGLGEDIEAFYDLLRTARDNGHVDVQLGGNRNIRRHTSAD